MPTKLSYGRLYAQNPAVAGLFRRKGKQKTLYFNTSISVGEVADKLADFLRGVDLPDDVLLAPGISSDSFLTKFKYKAKTKRPSDSKFSA